MADKAISELDDGGAVADADLVAVVRGGSNYKAALGSMAAEDASDYSPTLDFATVAFTGDANDLIGGGFYSPGGTDVAVADGGTGASDASGARTNLGLGTIATQAASNVTISGGSITGITDLAVADGGTGASTAANARTNLGVTATGSDTTYCYRANNLSDVTASTARTNLGLGTIATQASNNVTITGGSVTGITDIAIADGGTGASTAAGALTNLGVTGAKTIPIMAGAMRPSATGGCSAYTVVATSANQPDICSLDFDASTQEYAQFSIPMPKSWDESTITAKFFWSHASTSTNFGVVWNLQGVAVSDDDTIAVNYGSAQQVADTGGTTNDQYVTSVTSAITIAGTPAVGDMLHFRVSRVTGDGSDTMAIDARLHAIHLYFNVDAGNDA